MAVNISHPELSETKAVGLPPASLETLKVLRNEMCSISGSSSYKLQPQQRFLRRVLSPDSPVRNLLMVHGTGSGKTCSSIQIAEEYIIRPEYQGKKVLVLANPAVQSNYIKEIFNIDKTYVDESGLLLSKQCTGRRYLEMLQRIQNEPMRWSDKATNMKLRSLSEKLVNEFYEFQGYNTFANTLINEQLKGTNHLEQWIHDTFDNRIIIVDEAHNIKMQEAKDKRSSKALEDVIRVAHNVTLILLTATPMFDTFEEILYYFNLFLWNDRRQPMKSKLLKSAIFNDDGTFISQEAESSFRGWCQDYVSFVKGDNPLAFPFRLPPPSSLICPAEPKRDFKTNRRIEKPRKYVTLTQSFVQGIQEQVLKGMRTVKTELSIGGNVLPEVICVYPENKRHRETFISLTDDEALYDYSTGTPKFLAPSQVSQHSSKFALITTILKESKGIAFVYSGLVESGAELFAMCLEEHGYENASGQRLLKSTSGEVPRGSAGKYVLFTSNVSDSEMKRMIDRVKSRENIGGTDIRVIIASPRISEGVDLWNIRQVHVLDYWYNLSKIEQIVGRGIRTCSHKSLPFEYQNCTVYLHTCRFSDTDRETIDEYWYRYAEEKAVSIANVKKVIMESAMDCPLEEEVNRLPTDWRNLEIPQIRSQQDEEVKLTLGNMASPDFGISYELTCKVREVVPDPEHTRPLSSYIDVRDELLDIFIQLFMKKPVWLRSDLLKAPELQKYKEDVIIYTIQNAIETGFQIRDAIGRIGHIESKGNYYSFAKSTQDTLQDKLIDEDEGKQVQLPKHKAKQAEERTIETIRASQKWIPGVDKFSTEVLDWYIVDQVLTEKEKITHLLSIDWDNPPIYAKPLDLDSLRVFGSKQIYTPEGEKITPIGREADIYEAWLTKRKQLFIANKDKFFATVDKGVLKFNIDDKSTTLKRAQRTNNISGRACTSFFDPTLRMFSEWLGEPIPKEIRTKQERCQYLALLVRQAILDKKEGIVWWTPEEWSIFNEDANRKELLAKMK